MDTNEYDEQNLFVVDFSQNIYNITGEQDDNSDNDDNFKEIWNEKNFGGNRGRGRGQRWGQGWNSTRNNSSGMDNREQIAQLPPLSFFNAF